MSLPFLQPYFGLSNSLQTTQASSVGASPTRGIFAGGAAGANSNVIDYITIATTGNATDFGDLSATRYAHTACASATRGIFAGGYTPSTSVNIIEYVTIATTGNVVDFGDLTVSRYWLAGCAGS